MVFTVAMVGADREAMPVGNMQLPLLKTFELLQTRWKSLLDPVLSNPTTNLTILKNVSLASGNNQIAHLLGQVQQGWIILDIQAAANIYRYKDFNANYLYLNASAPTTVNLGVF